MDDSRSNKSFMRLLAECGIKRPAPASPNSHGSKPSAPTASKPPTAADVTVSGKTHARTRTSHFETTSTLPGGGLQVRSTKPHRHNKLRSRTGAFFFAPDDLVVRAMEEKSLQGQCPEGPVKRRRGE